MTPDNIIPWANVPTWLAFSDARTDTALRVYIALVAFGGAALWIPFPITERSRQMHRDRQTIYRALSWLEKKHLLMVRQYGRERRYRVVLQPEEVL